LSQSGQVPSLPPSSPSIFNSSISSHSVVRDASQRPLNSLVLWGGSSEVHMSTWSDFIRWCLLSNSRRAAFADRTSRPLSCCYCNEPHCSLIPACLFALLSRKDLTVWTLDLLLDDRFPPFRVSLSFLSANPAVQLQENVLNRLHYVRILCAACSDLARQDHPYVQPSPSMQSKVYAAQN
jgi:hypothetical protein